MKPWQNYINNKNYIKSIIIIIIQLTFHIISDLLSKKWKHKQCHCLISVWASSGQQDNSLPDGGTIWLHGTGAWGPGIQWGGHHWYPQWRYIYTRRHKHCAHLDWEGQVAKNIFFCFVAYILYINTHYFLLHSKLSTTPSLFTFIYSFVRENSVLYLKQFFLHSFFAVNEEWLEGHTAGNIGIFPRCFAYRDSPEKSNEETSEENAK